MLYESIIEEAEKEKAEQKKEREKEKSLIVGVKT